MNEYIIYGVAFLLGGVVGWVIGKYTQKPGPLVVPPPSGETAPYEVRLNGRVLYRGWDLTRAKLMYKDPNLPHNQVVELYGHGNHIASRHS